MKEIYLLKYNEMKHINTVTKLYFTRENGKSIYLQNKYT